MKQQLVKLARRLTGNIVFLKSLPKEYFKEKIYVTSRSDIRLLAPGLERSAGDLLEVVRRCVSEGDVVWDVGSNLGILTFCSAIRVGRDGRVYSLEADPKYADIQTRTLKRFSKDAGKVTILCAAVADKFGILDFMIPKKGHARSHLSVVSGNSAGETEMIKQVVTVTLDLLLDYWDPPKFIKIDVEGAEVLALKGATNLFSGVRPIAYIECAPENQDVLSEFFKKMNYSFFAIRPTGEEVPIETLEFNTLVRPNDTEKQCGAAVAMSPNGGE